MISIEQYFGIWIDKPDATPLCKSDAAAMLGKVNALLAAAAADGVPIKTNPKTGSGVSGETLGGFRPQNATQGSARSKHKTGHAIDIYDPANALDDWLDDATLAQFELYREHPDDTHTWCHLQDLQPGSGNRTFKP
jgi:hypothetical protein